MHASNSLSVVQNFICTVPQRLQMMKSEVPKMGNIFQDYEFYVNYDSEENVDEVYDIYKDSIEKLNWQCDTSANWAEKTLELVEKTNTSHILYLCEDFVFAYGKDEWDKVLNEALIENNIDFMFLAKINKYTTRSYLNEYEHGKHLFYYHSSNSPSKVLSIDGIFKREYLIKKLKEYIKIAHTVEWHDRDWPALNLPNSWEMCYSDNQYPGIRSENLLCCMPKKCLIFTVHPGGLAERWMTPEDQLIQKANWTSTIPNEFLERSK